ncbi:MAG: nucleotide sugar dehydrogenase [Verrucomicrobiae bacterium]|nr:nucleotide sugar dehydrogenase [Verrucomicrobiae bacterium]MDW8345061.1 nucleotide sugar dehydrogenase [Verrucomicrobiae bacterium]
MNKPQGTVAVVGLGYVGLPLATALAEHVQVVGFDINSTRIRELQQGIDRTGETLGGKLQNPNLSFTTDPKALRSCKYIIVAVPTPVDNANVPDLEPIRSSARIVGENLSPGSIVVYESTVYPGVTEEIALPILEQCSGLKLGQFKIGYSPERINPGDREHTLDKIVKIVAGCDPETTEELAALYGLVAGGIHKAPNIKTAEAAKVIENIQRDLNIALMNELSLIFARLGLHTDEVLAAASTKWNFHRYHPGLVGGHCIGVDPYYLTYRAQQLGYHPQVILAGRFINDSMARYVGNLVLRGVSAVGKPLKGASVLVMGLTFKENVPDIRNSKVHDTILHLQSFGMNVIGCDPLVPRDSARAYFGVDNVPFEEAPGVDAILIVNKHDCFKSITLTQLRAKMTSPVLVDIKNMFNRYEAIAAGFHYTSL